MAHIGEEDRFCAIDFRQRFSALAGCLVRSSVCDRTGNTARDEIEKAVIGIVERPAGTGSCNKESRWLSVPPFE